MYEEKLVRDRIPERMRSCGSDPVVYTAKKEGFSKHLFAKLREETEELCDNPCEEEVADILEVLDAIRRHFRFGKEKVERIKRQKAREKGRFNKRLIWKRY